MQLLSDAVLDAPDVDVESGPTTVTGAEPDRVRAESVGAELPRLTSHR